MPPIVSAAWTLESPGTAPDARCFHEMVYDAARDEVLLFGGDKGHGSDADRYNDETWVWNGTIWTQRTPGTTPAGRQQYGLAYDPVAEKALMFGGAGASGVITTTYSWDGTDWANEGAFGNPDGYDCGMAFDGTQIIAFGGELIAGGATADTTWAWDWGGATWTDVSPGTSPDSRHSFGIAYDAARGLVVIFGGQQIGSGTIFADTWVWDGSAWTDVTPGTSPSARTRTALAYDPGCEAVILFGGFSGSGVLNDTWAWDGTGWTNLGPTGTPTARDDGHYISYHESTERTVLFGGYVGAGTPPTGLLGDTRTLATVCPTPVAISHRFGLG